MFTPKNLELQYENKHHKRNKSLHVRVQFKELKTEKSMKQNNKIIWNKNK